MVKLAKEKAEKEGAEASFAAAGASELPFKDSSFDHAMLVAVLHVTKDREKCLSEIMRVLKPGGTVFLTVWNKNQPRFFLSRKEEPVPWKLGSKAFMRYYYLFTKGELKRFLEQNGFEVLSARGSRKKAFRLFPVDIIAVARKN